VRYANTLATTTIRELLIMPAIEDHEGYLDNWKLALTTEDASSPSGSSRHPLAELTQRFGKNQLAQQIGTAQMLFDFLKGRVPVTQVWDPILKGKEYNRGAVVQLVTVMLSRDFEEKLMKGDAEVAQRVRSEVMRVRLQLFVEMDTLKFGDVMEAARNWEFEHIDGMHFKWAAGQQKADASAGHKQRLEPAVWRSGGRGKSTVQALSTVTNRVCRGPHACRDRSVDRTSGVLHVARTGLSASCNRHCLLLHDTCCLLRHSALLMLLARPVARCTARRSRGRTARRRRSTSTRTLGRSCAIAFSLLHRVATRPYLSTTCIPRSL